MKYKAKQPTIDAVRFNGVRSLIEIESICPWRAIRYEEGMAGRELYISLREGEKAYEVKRGDYIVVETVAGVRRVTIVPEDEFNEKYEALPAAEETGPIIARGANPMGYAQSHSVLDPAATHNPYATGEAFK